MTVTDATATDVEDVGLVFHPEGATWAALGVRSVAEMRFWQELGQVSHAEYVLGQPLVGPWIEMFGPEERLALLHALNRAATRGKTEFATVLHLAATLRVRTIQDVGAVDWNPTQRQHLFWFAKSFPENPTVNCCHLLWAIQAYPLVFPSTLDHRMAWGPFGGRTGLMNVFADVANPRVVQTMLINRIVPSCDATPIVSGRTPDDLVLHIRWPTTPDHDPYPVIDAIRRGAVPVPSGTGRSARTVAAAWPDNGGTFGLWGVRKSSPWNYQPRTGVWAVPYREVHPWKIAVVANQIRSQQRRPGPWVDAYRRVFQMIDRGLFPRTPTG